MSAAITPSPTGTFVRTFARNFTQTFTLMVHNGTSNISKVEPPEINYNFSVFLWHESTTRYPEPMAQYFMASYSKVISGDQTAYGIIGQSLSFQVMGTITLATGSRCKDSNQLCVAVINSDDSYYRDLNYTNNALCNSIESVMLCQPVVDMKLASFEVTSSEPAVMTRNMQNQVNLTVDVTALSGVYDIAHVQDDDENFVFTIHLTSSNCTGNLTCLSSSNLITLNVTRNLTEVQRGLDIGKTMSFSLESSFEFNFTECEASKFFCLKVVHGENASFQDTSVNNNVMCQVFQPNCTPFVDTTVEFLDFDVKNSSWLSRYSTLITLKTAVTHVTGLHVTEVIGDRFNFQPFVFLQAADSVEQVSPLWQKCVFQDLQQRLESAQTINISCDAMILIDRDVCPRLANFCVVVNDSNRPSFIESDMSNNLLCNSLDGAINCPGLPVTNATCSLSDVVLTFNDNFVVTAQWDVASTIEVNVTFGNGDFFYWNWMEQNHTATFGRFGFDTSYEYKTDVGTFPVSHSSETEKMRR
ncbi:MAG: hypothetical protein V2I33_17530 [Kangiellaceae bacterium]|nr:hypothetical protein [Kangiellaceae bacterium]